MAKKRKAELVRELLQTNTDGLTVTEIADSLSISRNTVAVALAELNGAGMLRVRPVGMAKLHYYKDPEMRGNDSSTSAASELASSSASIPAAAVEPPRVSATSASVRETKQQVKKKELKQELKLDSSKSKSSRVVKRKSAAKKGGRQ